MKFALFDPFRSFTLLSWPCRCCHIVAKLFSKALLLVQSAKQKKNDSPKLVDGVDRVAVLN